MDKHASIDRPLGQAEREWMRAWLLQNLGHRATETQERSMLDFVINRLELLQVSFEEYQKLLTGEERQKLIDAVTVAETYFFRENPQFDVLKNHVFLELSKHEKISLWSAACASGEEAVSLALLCESYFRRRYHKEYFVLASDISSASLAKFQRNLYGDNSFREDGKKYHFLVKDHSKKADKYFRIQANILKNIQIEKINLLDGPGLAWKERFDVIFLRNVLIYMQAKGKRLAVENVLSALRPGGFLFVSRSETVWIEHKDLNLEEVDNVFFYRKKLPSKMRSESR